MAKIYLGIVLIFCFCLTISRTSENDDHSTLQLISMLFRHGDRTPESNERYPNDPYKDDNFYPIGEGQLTNVGKKRAYDFGLLLKERYRAFLGDIYYLPNIYAHSTEITRCKMTLQLVLAALYPPVKIQEWNSMLHWQPLDFTFNSSNNDILLLFSNSKLFTELFFEVINSPEIEEEIKQLDTRAITECTGYIFNKNNTLKTKNNTLIILYTLYNTIYSQLHMENYLKLPECIQKIFPGGPLLNGALLFLKVLGHEKLNYLNGAVLLNKIINDMNEVIIGTLTDRKINLYSGHDINVVGLQFALNIFNNRTPEFTSGIIIELHKKDSEYYVKVLQHLGIPTEIEEVIIPGCEKLCPYNKFIQLTNTNGLNPPKNSEQDKNVSTLFSNF
ncbi:venom acid phosphatase Acph-1-like [Pogonomyrmex barbatus]|uniref:acid phosphatase n=1 Tax=Pogonomyrmex barbatus TaxID=144034 RepID=A0A6I9W9S1_9HYME|nr:venom acid phosphatase Acph-1-like [Pogonomyrmex barbatus]XP_011635539.1 venom acid phosphatase Acph-1-like [Pogonomyrmex barbatus]XP_025073814.1 venom acid phosphatase Acph-1-like [Pogonomyrmex barbatus]XP_025073815.1 venom acid phosphatase Acph-1-like [Pogonomyrmex barbatus]